MQYIKSQSHTKPKFFDFIITVIFSVLVLFNSGSALSTVYGRFAIPSLLSLILLLIFFLPNAHIRNKKGKLNKSIFAYGFFIVSFVFTVIFNDFDYGTLQAFLRPALLMTCALFITLAIDFQTFIDKYLLIMKFLVITSLIAFIYVNLAGMPNLSLLTNINGKQFYNGYIFFFANDKATSYYRNISIFWEPGIFASFLTLALLLELCFKKAKINLFNVFLFVIGMLSTLSSAGYALLFFVLMIYLCRRVNGYRLMVILMILVLTFITLFYFDEISNMLLSWNYTLFNKFFAINETSTSTRLNSPYINYLIFSESPLFGKGFSKANQLYQEMMPLYNASAQTSTTFYMLASLGLPGFYYTWLWVKSFFTMKNLNFLAKIAISSTIMVIVNKEPHTNILITYCLLFYFANLASESENQPLKDEEKLNEKIILHT